MSRIHKIILGLWKCISLGKVSVNMFFWKILKVGYLGRPVCADCLLKDDMPVVSGSYMIKVNYYIEKSGLLFFKKLRKMGPTISARK